MIYVSFLLAIMTTLSAPEASTPDHSLWEAVLQQYVSEDGAVNYKKLAKNNKDLNAYLEELANHPPMDSWSRDEKLAYWINVYNAFTVKLIVDNYPVKSIRDLHDGNPWDVKWIKLGRQTYSLNQIEHDIIRPSYNEPRIHFAVNCAAQSCPPLLNHAWTADNLEQYLEQQTQAFINNEAYNTISAKSLELSQIFNWYGEDFDDVKAFVDRYTTTDVKDSAKVSFREYNWALNAQ
ncbi:DUF547 domain-containing protein [Phaeodactylibacter xiamenensis]|jgi:hypothetical protein|uniref:DUF547 domain-containing protein n=1 Tax=Phaeodactylibacter xiamenensis TaxID=1524460 RepID=UPI0024A9C76C|nr:DUF547 domain-containing protein [Phaeodactylibacter xiamenensis]